MKAHVLDEPQLEFRAGNRHIDPRYGISVYGPADADSPTAPDRIPIAVIGPAQAVNGIRSWLQRCRDRIEAKDSKPGQENLHQPILRGRTTNPPGSSRGTRSTELSTNPRIDPPQSH
ncbi:hypothetical protein ACQP0C_13470 [Nocardia sp. CA-129566]|uniref:hypothetical protein n=1 Tax=Nocardia sp. CA-129566 TaxID=3239976 RepID=UPI003D99433E